MDDIQHVGNSWFIIKDDFAREFLPVLKGEPGIRIIEEPLRITLHRTHLPLINVTPDVSMVTGAPEVAHYWWEELFRSQKDDARWIQERHAILLANPLGAGKTRTVIAGGDTPYMVVCPKTAYSVWEDEFDYAGLSWRLLEGAPPAKFSEVKAFLQEDPPDAWIIGYANAAKWLPYFCDLGPMSNTCTLIADEAHYLQKKKLNWAAAFRKVHAKKRVLITATPIRNRLASLWPLLDAASPGAWGSQFDWRQAYCAATRGEYGWEDGTPTEEAVRRLGRRLSEVIIKRPPGDKVPLKRESIPVKLEPAVLAEVVRRTGELSAQHEDGGQHLAWMTAMRQEFGILKVPEAIEQLKTLLPKWRRCVLWIWHDSVAKALQEALEDEDVEIDIILGRTSQKKRDLIAREWKHGDHLPDKPKVLIASIGAASTAVSFTTCGLSIFLEIDYAPLQMQQAEARTWRFGQKNESCLTLYLTVPGTIDEAVATILLDKAAEAERILGKDGQSDQMSVLLSNEIETDADFMKRIAEKVLE